MATNDNIIDKIKYLGLDLENIPKFIKEVEPLNYSPVKYDDEHVNKVYRYVDIKNIQILFTKANRLSTITEKYNKALPLIAYLSQEDGEQALERYTKFLSMVDTLNQAEIAQIEKEQEALKKNIPFSIKYQRDYLWQIYYSEATDKYFMMVPTEDLDFSAFFYLLKKQIAKSKDKIFVPITYMSYTNDFLTKEQISDIENSLWLFTKGWPIVYEVADKKGNITVQIVGETFVYDDIKSEYKIVLKDKEEALTFYKLIKALFILQTELPHHYNFETAIDKKGTLEFKFNDKKIIYSILSSIIKEEYLKAEEKKINLTDEKIKLEKELDDLQKMESKLEKEYLEKEKQISTFLECKKTFFGRVKYFFKYKKVSISKMEETPEKSQEIKVIRLNKYGEVKSNYTLEELIEIYKQIDKDDAKVKNLSSDIKALKQKNINLFIKVKNAIQYIEEIDKHKKSIFDFWKFTNKDKADELPEGTSESETNKKLKRTFNFELDFEDLAMSIDRLQRKELSDQEINSLYLTTTDVLEDINNVINENEIPDERLKVLKEQATSENLILERESFDIFGGISYDNKIKNLANKKHREAPRQIFKILDINKNTTKEEYTSKLEGVIKNIQTAFDKIKKSTAMPVYKISDEEIETNKLNAFNVLATEELKALENENPGLNLYKINLKENMPIIAFSNIIYYDNKNQTLPLGMNISKKFLLNSNLFELEIIKKKDIYVLYKKKEQTEFEKAEATKLHVIEYNIKEKKGDK